MDDETQGPVTRFLLARADEEYHAAPVGQDIRVQTRRRAIQAMALYHPETPRYVEYQGLCDPEPTRTRAGWDTPFELLLLVQEYRDHPGFHPSWRVEL